MNNHILGVLGNVIATIGVIVCAVAGINRLLGSYHLLGYEAMTFFIGGISLMVFAALIKLHIIKQLLAAK